MICSAISSLVGCGTSLGRWLVEWGESLGDRQFLQFADRSYATVDRARQRN
ncbi:hypothetical protein QUA20_00730 [Microcoleus sp. Pol7_A1]|uniref:hypothetical protein n=1 Tax=Microcoleus sp. Pol7_A1 TaxID=2818893 RepID=UPI002FD033BE